MPVIPNVLSTPGVPKRVDAVVIGAGIVGLSTALELQAHGLSVAVVEKGEVAAEQSSRNWGWCRQMGRDPREIPLIKISIGLWREMNKRIGRETGYRSCGIVYLSDTDAGLAKDETWLRKNAAQYALSTRMVSSAQASELAPGSTLKWKGGLYTHDDGRAEPFIAVPAMAEHFKQLGGLLLTQCAARGVETAAGRVCSVVTEHGVIATDSVVLAGGYWSQWFMGNLGQRLPQTGVISSVMRTSKVDLGHERTFAGGAFAMRKRLDGGYTIANNIHSVADLTPNHLRFMADFLPLLKMNFRDVKLRIGKRFVQEWQLKRRWQLDEVTPFEEVRILDPKPYDHLLADAARALVEAYPAFRDMRIEERWAGMIDATPDAVPVIDQIEAVPGLHLATGFSGHGFGLGPGAGKLMAEIVMGKQPCVDPSPFRFSRFSDGSKFRPTTGV
jgi:glycine/D-amino acid oxidase-like deaminating enzyme